MMKNKIYIIMISIFLSQAIKSQNPEWLNFNTSNSNLPSQYIRTIAVDSTGNIWVGGLSGYLSYFKNNTWNTLNELTDIGQNEIKSIQVDTNNIVCIGHLKGMSRYDINLKTWEHFKLEEAGLLYNEIYSLSYNKENEIFIGSGDNTLIKYDDKMWFIFRNDSLDSFLQCISAIAIDNNNIIWCGFNYFDWSEDKGLGIISKYDGEGWENYIPYISQMPWSSGIMSIVIDRFNNKWIGSINGGLIIFDDNTFTSYNMNNSGIAGNRVFSIAIDDNNVKWIGTDNGLNRFDGVSWTIWDTSNSLLASNMISSIVIDKYDNKWISMFNGGIAVYNEDGVIIDVEEDPKKDDITINCSPNPVYGSANIKYCLPEYSHVIIKVFDIYGNTIEVLKDEYKERGIYNISFNTSALPAGIYFFQLQTQSGTITKKMIVVK
jgi:ligand-binding sensor domain-containing protein